MKRKGLIIIILLMFQAFSSNETFAIEIDGNDSDWKFAQTVYLDPEGDCVCDSNSDIKKIYTSIDDTFAYLMVETYGKPINPNIILEINLDYKPGAQHWPFLADDLHTNIYGSTLLGWTGNYYDGNWELHVIEGSTITWGDVLEVKIPLQELGNPTYFKATFASTWNYAYPLPNPGPGCDPSYIVAHMNYATIFSEHRQYDSKYFQFEEGNVYYQGNPYWSMMAYGFISKNTDHPVKVQSDITGIYKLHSGTWKGYPPFFAGAFFDFIHHTYGGPFPAPGVEWEDKTYVFSIENTPRYWYIPSGSLKKLSIPKVTITGTAHPTISWEPVPGADGYRVAIAELDQKGFPDTLKGLFMSEVVTTNSYKYTGDLFEYGREYALMIIARENHPYAQNDSNYRNEQINQSSFVTKYPAPKIMTNDHSFPTGSIHAYNNLIWPPNNKMVKVALSGNVKDELSMIRDGNGIGVSEAYILLGGVEKLILKDEEINLLDTEGNFNVDIEVKAAKGAQYYIELYASDTTPTEASGPNSGMVDFTYIIVPNDLGN